jgi:hypothetical protein
MTRDEIHPAMREAIGAFSVLRSFGFKSDDIFFHQNADESPGPEPRGMMFVVLKVRGKSFSISVGVVDAPYDDWFRTWRAVATEVLERRVEQADRIVEESLAFRVKAQLMVAIQAKGIRVPASAECLS